MEKNIDLSKYIGKEMQCSCGKTHFSAVKAVEIDAGVAKKMPGMLWKMGYRKLFLVADVNTWEAAGKCGKHPLKRLLGPHRAAGRCHPGCHPHDHRR